MVLTRDFKDTIKERVARDPSFREQLLKEGIERLLTGDVATGKAVLRNYINATIGFEALGAATDRSPKSLMLYVWSKGKSASPQPFSNYRPSPAT